MAIYVEKLVVSMSVTVNKCQIKESLFEKIFILFTLTKEILSKSSDKEINELN